MNHSQTAEPGKSLEDLWSAHGHHEPPTRKTRSETWGSIVESTFQRIIKNEEMPSLDLGSNGRGIRIERGELVAIGGPPGAGKSLLIMDWVAGAAEADSDLHVLVSNVEMTSERLLRRLVCNYAEVSKGKMDAGLLEPEDIRRIQEVALPKIEVIAPRIHFLKPPYIIEDLLEEARVVGADFIVGDYLQRISSSAVSGGVSSIKDHVSKIIQLSRDVAKDEGRTFVYACRVNDPTGGKKKQKFYIDDYGLASFSESSEIRYGFDQAFQFAEEGPDVPGVRILKNVKQREGETDLKIAFDFSGQWMRLTSRGIQREKVWIRDMPDPPADEPDDIDFREADGVVTNCDWLFNEDGEASAPGGDA